VRFVPCPLHVMIESFRVSEDAATAIGWLVAPGHGADRVSVSLDDVPWVDDWALIERPDVRAIRFPDLAHASRSGFAIEAPLPSALRGRAALGARFTARHEGRAVAAATLDVRDLTRGQRRIPPPPPELQRHVGELGDFPATGWRIYSDLRAHVGRYARLSDLRRVLDWGCGCGRVLGWLLEDVPAERVFGCDIDRDAIEWLAGCASGAAVDPSPAVPPLPYGAAFFDLVYGISVFTHLDEPTQFLWLEELARVCRPGGLVAVSVLGPSACPPWLRPALDRQGFADEPSVQRELFAKWSSPHYYRVTAHTPDYVAARWSPFFDVLEWIEGGINAHQDLVVMRRRA
jgi:SAM-dependent methyltransferase